MNAPDINLRLPPPHSNEAEQSVIGALILDNNAWDKIADVVSVTDFFRDDHRRLFGHIATLCNAGKPCDLVTLHAALEKSNELDLVGGLAYLGEIANATPSAANIRRYAEIVRDTSVRRRIIFAADEIAASAFNPSGKDTRALLDVAESKIVEISETRVLQSGDLKNINDVLGKAVDEIDLALERGSEFTGLPTGFADIDSKLSGMQPGDLIVIAGRPSMGKTAFAINIGENVGINSGKPVAIFSLEMGDTQIGKRMLASVGRIDLTNIRNGKLSDEEYDSMTVAMGKLSNATIAIDETGGLSVPQIRGRCRRMARKYGGIGLVVIDYLQLMALAKQTENRAQDLGDTTRALKALAKELHCPIVLLSQLSRKVEERRDRRPILSDLRDSGAIEQDADVVILMYRDEYYHPDTQEQGIAEVNIAKHRNGPTGIVRLSFSGCFSRFDTLAYGYTVPAPTNKPRGFRDA